MAISGGRGIEEMLGLPHMDDIIKPEPEPTNEVDFMKAAEQKLASIEGTDHAKAMDDIHTETLNHSRDIMDLAFNVDDRSRRGLLEIATSMYKNAIDSKNSKREMQLKVMKLMQDQQKIDLDERKFRAEMGEHVVDSKVTIVEDRNELLKRMRKQVDDEVDK